MNDDLESEYAARHDDHAERWASERDDAHRSALADRDEREEGPPIQLAHPELLEECRHGCTFHARGGDLALPCSGPMRRKTHKRYSDREDRPDLRALALCNNINGPICEDAYLTSKNEEVTCGRCRRIAGLPVGKGK